MVEQQPFDKTTNFTFSPRAEGIDPNAKIDLVGSMMNISSAVSEHGAKLADHDGQLKSLPLVVSSIQTTVNAWIAAAAVIVAGTALIGTLEFANGQKIDAAATKSDLAQRADKADSRADKIEGRIEDLNKDVKALPDLLAELLKRKR